MKKLNVVKLEESIWKCDIKKRKRHNICSRVNDCWFICNLNSTILLWLQFVCNSYYDQLSHKTDFSRRLLLPMVKKVGLLGDETKFGELWYPSEVLVSLYYLDVRWPEQQKQLSRSVLRKRCSENMQQIYRRTPMPKCDLRTPRPKCDFTKVAKQLYWNHTSVWVFSCKFAYFQNTFPWEHLWVAASATFILC